MACLFCSIASGAVQANPVFEDAEMLAIADIHPQAPMHVLVIPRKHISTLNDLTPEDDALLGRMIRRAADIAMSQGYDASGFRAVFNCNADGGQSVFHIHLHLLAGRPLAWPPG